MTKPAALAEDIRNQARWRWMKANEYPEDTRNQRCAEAIGGVTRRWPSSD
jgi:hypothetical protein